MHSTGIDRRRFLALAGAMVGFPSPSRADSRLWLSANQMSARLYGLGAFDVGGDRLYELELPGRGHGIAVSPDRRVAIVVARRPGTFAVAFDPADGAVLFELQSPDGRHFHGHGAFSGDGRLFFTAENDYLAGAGVIGVWDAVNAFGRLGEMSSHGIEPHDLRLMPDGRSLMVANGGIVTHPDTGRAKLNLDSMDSSLVQLDGRTGAMLGRWRAPSDLRLLSIRHLAVNRLGDVAVGMQYQAEDRVAPVVGLKPAGQPLRLLAVPDATAALSLRNYCGSIAMAAGGRLFAASCPRGDTVTVWRTADGAFVGAVAIADGCGVAAGPSPDDLVMTSGRGGVLLSNGTWSGTSALSGAYVQQRQWDNHAVAL